MKTEITLFGKPNEYVKVFCSTTAELKARIEEKMKSAESEEDRDYFRKSLSDLSKQKEDDYVICYQHHGNCMPAHICHVFPFFVDHGLAYVCSQSEDAHWYCSYFLVKEGDYGIDKCHDQIFCDSFTGKKFTFHEMLGDIQKFAVHSTTRPFI